MTTRREFLCTAAAASLSGARAARLDPDQIARDGAPEPYRQDKPLLELQQAFLDLRFGMFLHFNMATFQDREWGDPASSPDLFHPTALDTDQWAAAARSANMTWGCLTTRHHDGFCIWPTKTRGASIGRTSHSSDVVH